MQAQRLNQYLIHREASTMQTMQSAKSASWLDYRVLRGVRAATANCKLIEVLCVSCVTPHISTVCVSAVSLELLRGIDFCRMKALGRLPVTRIPARLCLQGSHQSTSLFMEPGSGWRSSAHKQYPYHHSAGGVQNLHTVAGRCLHHCSVGSVLHLYIVCLAVSTIH